MRWDAAVARGQAIVQWDPPLSLRSSVSSSGRVGEREACPSAGADGPLLFCPRTFYLLGSVLSSNSSIGRLPGFGTDLFLLRSGPSGLPERNMDGAARSDRGERE